MITDTQIEYARTVKCPNNTELVARIIFGLYDRRKFEEPKDTAAKQFLRACQGVFSVTERATDTKFISLVNEMTADLRPPGVLCTTGGRSVERLQSWNLTRGQEALLCALDEITPTMPRSVVVDALGVPQVAQLIDAGVVVGYGELELSETVKAWLVEDYLSTTGDNNE